MLSHWTSNNINVNGIQMHYIRTGNGEKPPLVLVHGRTDNGLCWAKTARKLESEYDIIMPDSRGHGLSDRLNPGDSLDNTGDLAGMIQTLKLDKPIIAGHSMGAASASELGARYPELPRALILEDPSWRSHTSTVNHAEVRAAVDPFVEWIKNLEGKFLDELVAENKPEYPTWDDEVLRAWCVGKMQMDTNFFNVQRLPRMAWQDIVQQITCPTLLITADQPGGIVSEDTAKQAVAMNSQFTNVHISGTGHHIRFENYEDYFGAFCSFLEKVT